MAKPFKLRYVNEIVGIFVLLIALLVVGAVVMGPHTADWFTPVTRLTIQLPPEGAYGLQSGNDVKILGTLAGNVSNISVTRRDKMEAELVIRGDFIRFVKTDSKAIIRPPLAGFGEAEVLITAGKGPALPDRNASILSEVDRGPTATLDETLDQLRNEALPALKEMRLAVAHFSAIGQKINEGQGVIGQLVTNPEMAAEARRMVPKFNSALDELEGVLKDLKKSTGELQTMMTSMGGEMKRLPQIMENTEKTIQGVRGMVIDLQKTAAGLPELIKGATDTVNALPGLLVQVQETTRQMEILTEAAQRHWLLREYVEKGDDVGGRIGAERLGTGGGRR